MPPIIAQFSPLLLQLVLSLAAQWLGRIKGEDVGRLMRWIEAQDENTERTGPQKLKLLAERFPEWFGRLPEEKIRTVLQIAYMLVRLRQNKI